MKDEIKACKHLGIWVQTNLKYKRLFLHERKKKSLFLSYYKNLLKIVIIFKDLWIVKFSWEHFHYHVKYIVKFFLLEYFFIAYVYKNFIVNSALVFLLELCHTTYFFIILKKGYFWQYTMCRQLILLEDIKVFRYCTF